MALGCLVVVAAATLSGRASAAYVEVYGGPTFTPADGGFINPFLPIGIGSGPAVNAAGVGIAYAEKRSGSAGYGLRGISWGPTGHPPMELGNLGVEPRFGSTEARAYGINDAGAAAGYAQKYDAAGTSFGYRAVRWSSDGTATELANLGTDTRGATVIRAYGLNASGTVVGDADKYDPLGINLGKRAVRWDGAGTAATELGNLGASANGTTHLGAIAVNRFGTVIGGGDKYDAAGNFLGERIVRWDGSGTAATELEELPDSFGSNVYALNSSGTAVGSSNRNGLVAVRWDGTGTSVTELDTLRLASSGSRNSLAYAVNDAGTAVGFSSKADAQQKAKGLRAVRWDGSGTAATELGNLGTDPAGYTDSVAYAINSAGTAAGYANAYDASGALLGPHAVYWGDDTRAIDLNPLVDPNSGWVLIRAQGISDTGWLTGIGSFDPDGPGGQAAYNRTFVMQVPEPSAAGLVAGGSGGLLLVWRRRRGMP